MKRITITALSAFAALPLMSGLSSEAQAEPKPIPVHELMNWHSAGQGTIGTFRDRALQMTEASESEGLMIVSPDSYGEQVVLRFSAMTLRPATVLVVMLSASDADGSGQLTIPDDFDGDLANWNSDASDYFFAFHNAPHFRYPFIIRRHGDSAELLEEASRSYMTVGRWHEIECGRDGNRLWLTIDGKTVLDVEDPGPLEGGSVALRIRGSGTERASAFFKDLTLSEK